MTARYSIKGAAAAALLVAAAGCADLDVANPNEPDRERALKNGQDVEALVSGTFRTWWGVQQGAMPTGGTNIAEAMAAASDELANSGLGGTGEVADEPRIAAINEANYRWGDYLTYPWYNLSRSLAAIRDGLLSVKGGVKIGTNGADGPRFEAFAKLMQGLAFGDLALIYDKGFVLDETIADPSTVTLIPYTEVMAQARKYLAQARDLAGKSTFTIPTGWMGTASYPSQELIRIASSYEARYMVWVARTPAERAAVDWNTVLIRVQQGITRDFGVQLDGPGGRWAAPHKGSIDPRMKLPYLGPADQSGGWQRWEQSPPAAKLPFLIDTDDRRVTGGTPTSSGTLIKYWSDQTASPARGLYFFSNYTSSVWTQIATTNLGFAPDITVQEMQYLAAEAYIRTNRPELALPIINKTRVENGKLPPATVSGVSGPRCVPRTIKGACGNLLETLAWEKQIMLPLITQGSLYYDKRGFGTLRAGTWLQLPVPAKDLISLKLPVYTFGGAGGVSTATGP